jgi:Glycosyl hydrolase family 76
VTDPALAAQRAVRAYRAMRRRFARPDGVYRRDGWPRLPGAAAHLWPLARALVAALDLAGAPAAGTAGFDPDSAIAWHLAALDRYWDPSEAVPGYASDVIGSRWGGDRYYDDNAWVGLGLVQLERLRPASGRLERAAALWRFAAAAWDRRSGVPAPGGVFWVEQGRGLGRRNHDRNTVSTAPNAQLALHLEELSGPPAGPPGGWADPDPAQMCAWVETTLSAGGEGGAEDGDEDRATGLFWDKVRGDGSIDRTLWSYNQGNMLGLNLLLARRAGAAGDATARARHLGRAEAIARRALRHYDRTWESQPPAFNAICFRNLLALSGATGDAQLRAHIRGVIEGYGEAAWQRRRDRRDGFRFSSGPVTLLDQSAMVSVFALLAWDPIDYGALA